MSNMPGDSFLGFPFGDTDPSPLDGYRAMDEAFSLARYPGVEHLVEEDTGKQFLLVDGLVPYPTPDGSIALQEILLPRIDDPGAPNQHFLALPENYATMAQALNDAIGNTALARSKEMAHDLFAELGAQLARIAEVDGVIPEEADYQNILFLRDATGMKFFPPLKMKRFESPSEARKQVVTELYYSCLKGTVTVQQRKDLDEAYRGFTELFTW